MPFTISHAVLAVPIAKLSKNYIPIASLAIGCMTPDLIRLIINNDRNISHQWSSIIYPDVLIGVIFLLLWYVLYRPYLYKIFAIQDKLILSTRRAKIHFVALSLLGIILGIVTHLLWDSLTHADERTLLFYHQLAQPIHLFGIDTSVHMVLQLLSSIIPLPIIAVMMRHYYQQFHTDRRLIQKTLIIFNGLIIILVGSVFLMSTFNIDTLGLDPYHTLGDSLISFFKGAILTLTLLSGLDRVLKYRI